MKHARTDGIDPAARSRSRRRALQAVYAWQLSHTQVNVLLEQFSNEQDMEVADLAYFEALVRGVISGHSELDQALSMYVDRPMEQVDPIERAVLRIAAFEMRDRLDVPYRVIINEAVEIAKRFGSDHGHTYVNGVLDQAAGQWRSAEINARR
jgi:N utilization substance protein B